MALSPPPLTGLRVVELAGLAPAPFAGLLLADFGASVLRIDRPLRSSQPAPPDLLTRHKSSIALDLKQPASLAILRDLLVTADVLIDPYRPGTLETLGLDPIDLRKANPRLIIARLTGFRRDGKYKDMAGHDINYLAVSGILSQLGRKDAPPYAPANLLADFAGGGLMCAVGILLALIQRMTSGEGQVVDTNMVDGSAYLGTFMRLMMNTPMWDRARGENVLDGGCPWYDVYECKDGKHMAVGALETRFFEELVSGLGLEKGWITDRGDRGKWAELKSLLEDTFRQKTRAEWEAVFDGKDACCTPVLAVGELEEAGYEQRPAVGLTVSPGHSVSTSSAWSNAELGLGTGGEDMLLRWMSWKKGRDYEMNDDVPTKMEPSKL